MVRDNRIDFVPESRVSENGSLFETSRFCRRAYSLPTATGDHYYAHNSKCIVTYQDLPEPLRSQVLYGDIEAGMQTVISTRQILERIEGSA